MYKDEQISYGVICLLMIIFWVWVVPNQISASEEASVSPRLVPVVCSVLIFLLSLGSLIRSFAAAENKYHISADQYRTLGLALVALFISAFLMKWIGFWIASIITVVAALWITEEREPRTMAIYTVGLLVISYVLVSFAGITLR